MDMPPSRYRVVEEGRRLVVIDTQRGTRPLSPAPRPRPLQHGVARRTRSPAPATGAQAQPSFTTSPLYDSKAPRTIVLDEAAGRRLGPLAGLAITALVVGVFVALAFPAALFIGAFALANPKVRGALRGAITRALDQAASVG